MLWWLPTLMTILRYVSNVHEQVFTTTAQVDLVLHWIIHLPNRRSNQSNLSLRSHLPFHSVVDTTYNRCSAKYRPEKTTFTHFSLLRSQLPSAVNIRFNRLIRF